RHLAEALKLTVVEVRDCPGFIVNRLLMPVIAEAARLLESGDADAQAIDTAMRMGCGHPMGPLALADMIGLDTILHELEQLDHELGPRYAPPEILLQRVADGHLGRKSGRGFHNYGG
ncbi:MAG: 3-hydroxyacyl-CoA dehydrogenase family protein, partial [Planctomycetota bacterium]